VEQASRQLRALHHFVSESLRQLPSATFVCDREGCSACQHGRAPPISKAYGLGSDLVALLTGPATRRSRGRHSQPAATPLLTHSALQQATLSRQSEGRDTQGRHLMLLSQPSRPRPPGWLITLVDISDLRSAQAQRDQAMQFISHDIRAP
jgi:hypothetical protein